MDDGPERTHEDPPAVWTLDELIEHARRHPDKDELRRAVVREGRLAADDVHRRTLHRRTEQRPPATAEDVRTMSDQSFEQMRRTQRRGGFRW